MFSIRHLFFIMLTIFLAEPVLGAAKYPEVKPEALSARSQKGVMISKKNKQSSRNVREKHINREAVVKSKDAKNIDFDAVDIGGQRKTPMGTLINQNKADKNYDFVKIRLRWHPEMVQSASSLDAGQ